MTNYILSCCSTADLSKQHFLERDIKYICFHYELDGKDYPDDLGESMPFDQFYKEMAAGKPTRTSQVNVEEFTEYFEPFLKEGKDILHLTLSSGISGVLNSANLARDLLSEKYPERTIVIVDSLAASSGYGLLMDKLADLRDEGKSLTEVAHFAEKNKLRLHHWFFSSDLTFFIRGGRISKTSGFIGGAIVDKMIEHAENGTDYSGKCYISNSACYEDARAVADLVEKNFPKLDGKVVINSIGTTIGSHTGPGTVALFFWGDERKD